MEKEKTSRSEVIIRVKGLCKTFGNNKVLEQLDLNLFEGENLAILGKSGSGKSVLIKCVIGLLEPDEGSIEVLGNDVTQLNNEELDKLRAKVGFLFQSNALYDSMTVRENLEFPLRRHWLKTDQETISQMVIDALTDVGLAHTVDMMPAELSGGMRKRIALARTLILRPQIILYDEPTTGLDPITGREISNLMVEISKKYNTASLIISHDMNCIKHTADRIAVLVNGKCASSGSYEELAHNSDPLINQFFQ
jgi:phospholipid/cholesterol/gamma-HCH transport system ATP-binding protein